MPDRILNWEACNNIRDLGGLKTSDGRLTRFGAVIRSDTPGRLTPSGWEALYAYGVRTIISLRTLGVAEPEPDITPPYADIAVIAAPIEDLSDREFVQQWVQTNFWGTPLYYADALQRWPAQHAAVVSAVARAQPGGVLFHCIRGHDRTGIIALVLLGLAGVLPDEIAADYALSPDSFRDELLALHNSSVPAAIRATLSALDLERCLLQAGLTPADLASLRRRLLG
jgi:protein tyrosine/serine phosphatase